MTMMTVVVAMRSSCDATMKGMVTGVATVGVKAVVVMALLFIRLARPLY